VQGIIIFLILIIFYNFFSVETEIKSYKLFQAGINYGFFLYKLLTVVCTCMQKFRALERVDICKQIFLYLSSYNFVQEITA
jgi:hypothetical protein